MQFFKNLFKKKVSKLNMKKYLIVGLGNIGEEYKNTRHNIGFEILNKLVEKNETDWDVKKLADYSSFKKKGSQFLLIKPSTFMNKSGKAVRYWALKEKIPLQNILIITDDLHLPFGSLRLRSKGSPAGHNGLKDIENQLNTSSYARLRFGIGQKTRPFDQVKFVLDQWNETEKSKINKRISVCIEAIVCFGLEGINSAMNRFNGK
tara:strand:+ start:1759 stop:2373 length:615 start_codon:yes stop_codon:yes gene_type:complete